MIHHTICSATDDSRFPPVTAAEVPRLTIRISALSPLEPIRPEAIVLGRHGLVIAKGRRSGLLLPEVPAHFGLLTTEDFLDALFRKAQLGRGNMTDDDIELYGFETEAWDDEEFPDFSACIKRDPELLD